MSKKKPRYSDAVRELEEILEGLEGDDVDIDDLSDKVERAAELIRVCREKLSATESKVTKVVSELEVKDDSKDSEAKAVRMSRHEEGVSDEGSEKEESRENESLEEKPFDSAGKDQDELPF